MSRSLPEIVGAWLHSYEEDSATTSVYRPHDYPFPPTRRARRGLEFRPDGTFVEQLMGRDDRPREVVGRWRGTGANHVEITFPDGRGPTYVLTVLSCANDALTIAK